MSAFTTARSEVTSWRRVLRSGLIWGLWGMKTAVWAAAFFIWVNVLAAFAGEGEGLALPGASRAWVHGEKGLGLAGEPGCV